jgi:folate-binding protein YgfZ
VTTVSETHSQLSSYCSPKGRMLACFRLFRRGDTFYLRLPRTMLEPTLKRLRMFVLRSRVTLEDASDALIRFGYSGPDAETELKEALGTCPIDVDDCLQTDDVTVLRIPGLHLRFELYGELTAMKQLWDRLNVRGAPVGASPWALLDILAGIPIILPPTRDRFVPQMANLERLGGVSFKKGCYPGQEVIARMRYLGTLKRRMYRLYLAADTVPQSGDEIFSAGGNEAEPSGTIIDAQPHPDGGVEALAVLRIIEAEHNQLRLGSPDGLPIAIRSLPYDF